MSVKELIKKEKDGLIARAYRFAEKAHSDQKRKNGEPYFNHSLEAAELTAEWGLDETTVAAALLHDVAEDTKHTVEDIKKEFSEEIAFLVDGVTKLGTIKYRGVEAQTENIRKMILALSQDIRVIIIKLADRLHNMRTLGALPPQKQKRIALETMEIYAPLAYRLGMQKISGELEDLAFPVIYPQEYQWLIKNVKDRYEERENYLKEVNRLAEKTLKENGVDVVFIDSRAKRYASLYKKLLRYDMDIEKIYDLVALRIIVKTVADCYAALGVIHKLWPPLPGRIKDYISLPKPNGYRSLHTTVFCLNNKITEIQIRTQEMHDEAEHGIAAHWFYEQVKGTKNYLERETVMAKTQELKWVQQLRQWQKKFSENEGFLGSLKIDFFKDRIFVITPKGEVLDLPFGATPIDFAYQIHSDIGDQAGGAKVNGRIVPLDHELRSGDVVEILVQKGKKPSESWLEFVKTAVAHHHIKDSLKRRGRANLIPKAAKPKETEFRLAVEDRIGLLKDVSAAISQSKVNIISISTKQTGGRFQTLKFTCDLKGAVKPETLLVKIKKIPGVREASYK